MSAGERAIFPILLDFANRNINNSIIIIDEVELHLHPPLQQALIRSLPTWGVNNQFFITTHSDSVAAMFSESQIIRLS
jgi:predicted ATP-dependent endonuclease of OLD family